MFGGKQVLLFVLVSFLFLAVTNGSDRSFISTAGDECKNEGKCPDPTTIIGETFLFSIVTTPRNKYNSLLQYFALRGFWADATIIEMATTHGDDWYVYSMQVEMRPITSMSAKTLDYIGCVNDKIKAQNKRRAEARTKGKPIDNLLIPYHHFANIVFRRTRTEDEITAGKDEEEFAMGYIERNGKWEIHYGANLDAIAAPISGIYTDVETQNFANELPRGMTLNRLLTELRVDGNTKYDASTKNCQDGAVDTQEKLLKIQGYSSAGINSQRQDMLSVIAAINFVTDKCYPTLFETVCDIGTKAATGLVSTTKKTLASVWNFLNSSEGQVVVGLVALHILGFEQELGNLEQDIDNLIA